MPISTIGSAGLAVGGVGRSNMYTGAVLQVVQSTYSTQTTTTTASFVATGLNASITPSSASSKVLVLTTAYFQNTNTAGVNGEWFYGLEILRGATLIFPTSSVAIYSASSFKGAPLSNSNYRNMNAISYLDSPATTSSTTYTLYYSAYQSSLTMNNDGGLSTMILMEIAA